MPPGIGYDYGQPFGDPNRFTRSTGEDEIDRFNQWLREQPWYQQIRGTNQGDLTENQRRQIEQALATRGVRVPKGFKIDPAGNFNQKNRLGRNLAIGAGAATAALGIPGLFPGLATGAIGGGGAAAGGLGALEAGVPLSGLAPSSLPGFVAAGGGSGLAGAAGAAAGIGSRAADGSPGALSRLLGGGDGFNLADVLRVAVPAGTALAGRAFSGRDESQQQSEAALGELLAEAMRRMRAQEPLFNAVNTQAMAGLPTYVKEGR